MKDALKEILKENETVQWESGPGNFPLLDADSRFPILSRWVISIVVCGGFLAIYAANNEELNPYIFGAAIFIVACVIISSFLERRNILGERYLITDQRVLLLAKNESSYYMEFSELDEFKIITGRTGRKSLVLGSSIFKSAGKQLRWLACHPRTDTQSDKPRDSAQGLVLYAPDQIETAISLLERHVKKAQPCA